MRIHHHVRATAALALTFGAISAPAALASTGSSPVVLPNPDEQTVQAPAAPNSPTVVPNPDQQTAAPTIVRVSAPSGGFDWGDAGIGAAGGFALSMLALGGALAVTERRRGRAGRGSARPAG